MSALAPIGPKLAKLIPRLASDHDGEVVATVRAIDRTLKNAGLDFNDLAGQLNDCRVPDIESEPSTSALPTFCANRQAWAEMLRKSIDADILTDWEQRFALTIVWRMSSPAFRPSAKQQAVAADIISKGWARGVRP